MKKVSLILSVLVLMLVGCNGSYSVNGVELNKEKIEEHKEKYLAHKGEVTEDDVVIHYAIKQALLAYLDLDANYIDTLYQGDETEEAVLERGVHLEYFLQEAYAKQTLNQETIEEIYESMPQEEKELFPLDVLLSNPEIALIYGKESGILDVEKIQKELVDSVKVKGVDLIITEKNTIL